MMSWLKLAIRNATRNLRRTLLTALTVCFGTALVVIALSWLSGVFGMVIEAVCAQSGHIQIVDKDYAARKELAPLYENIADAKKVLEVVKNVPGVTGAEPRISMGAVVTNQEELGDHFTEVIGASEVYYREQLKGPDNLLSGKWLSAEKQVVLGRKVAEKLEAKLGETILLLGQTQYGSMSPISGKLVGVVGGDASLDHRAFVAFEEMEWMADLEGGALEILVWSDSRESRRLSPIVDTLRAAPELEGLEVNAWYGIPPFNTMMGIVDGMQGFIQFLVVFITALAIFNTMTMSVLERTGEIGVMRAMGLTRLGALSLFVVEAVAIGFIGGVAGALLGAGPAYYLEVKGVTLGQDMVDKIGSGFPMKATFFADLSPGILVQAVILGIVIAILGAVLPALRAASVQPVSAMRARR